MTSQRRRHRGDDARLSQERRTGIQPGGLWEMECLQYHGKYLTHSFIRHLLSTIIGQILE